RIITRLRWKIISQARQLPETEELQKRAKKGEEITAGLASREPYAGKIHPKYFTRVLRAAPDAPAALTPEDESWRPKEKAAWFFCQLITNPCHADLHRCACCGNYFVNDTDRAKRTYCSNRCRTQGTAKKAMAQKRLNQKLGKIEEAAQLIRDW